MTEQDIQADYTRKVVAAREGLAKALTTRIATLKAERDQALALIREGERLNAESQGNNEAGGEASQAGEEPQGGAESSLGESPGKNPEGEGQGEEEAQEPGEEEAQE